MARVLNSKYYHILYGFGQGVFRRGEVGTAKNHCTFSGGAGIWLITVCDDLNVRLVSRFHRSLLRSLLTLRLSDFEVLSFALINYGISSFVRHTFSHFNVSDTSMCFTRQPLSFDM